MRSFTAGVRLWPWSPQAALAAVPIVFLALLGALVLARRLAGWPGNAYQGWTLLAVVLLSLLPVILLVVEAAARNRGQVSAFGVSLSFAGASREAAVGLRTATLEENLNASSEPTVQQTELPSLIAALRRAHDSDVTVVDLRAGRTWWETRLFILVAGAARRGRPRALAFVGDLNGQRDIFIGWASPSRLLDLHLAADDSLRLGYASASSLTAQFELSTPIAGSQTCRPSFGTRPRRSACRRWHVGRPTPTSRSSFLQQQLETGPNQQRRYVTVTRLRELYEPALVTDHIETGSSDDDWVNLLRKQPRPFFAVTDEGSLRSLVPPDALLTALVLRLAEAEEQRAAGESGSWTSTRSSAATSAASRAAERDRSLTKIAAARG